MKIRRNQNAFGYLVCLVFVSILSFGHSWSHKNFSKDVRPNLVHERREILQQAAIVVFGLTSVPAVASAGEVGAKITKAVTTSDLGISVRRSVVEGAQVMDKLDSQWEQFSDRFGLGTARSQQPNKPAPKVIPEPKPLDSGVASKILDTSDQCFLALTKLGASDLQKQIEKVVTTVGPSFERSGLSVQDMQTKIPQTGEQFNFLTYAHYKAYSDLIIERKIDFRAFRKDFEDSMGRQLLMLLLPNVKPAETSSSKNPGPAKLESLLQQSVQRIDRLCRVLVDKGLVAQIDTAPLEDEKISDWAQDLADLQWSIALDGDITLKSQILLQEQGFRLYPNYARYAIQTILQAIDGQSVEVTDYYMDTDYNSDPDKFDVKEVLLNIVLESV